MRLSIRLALCALLLSAAAAVSVPARADINLLQYDSLIEATMSNDTDTVENLLDKGHFVDPRDDKKRTPLIIAAARGYVDIVDLLVLHKAAVNDVDEFGNTAMFYAAVHNNIDILGILIEAEGNVNAKNRQGVTPLMGAAEAGSVAAVEKLLDAHAKPAETDYTGRTARDYALQAGRRLVLSVFKQHGVKE